jgi:hypothetical protein
MTPSKRQPTLDWIDDELRGQKKMVAELRETVQEQAVIIADQAGRLRELQERLAAALAQRQRIGQLEESIQQTKNEVTILLHNLREEQRKTLGNLQETRRLEREVDVTAINKLSEQLSILPRIEKQLDALAAEDRRLHETHLKSQEAFQQLDQRVGRQEEGATLLGTRHERDREQIGRLTEGLGEAQEALKPIAARLSLLEQTSNTELLGELKALGAQLQRGYDEFLEEQRRAELPRQKRVAEWARQMENLSRQLDLWGDQMRRYADQHEKNRKVVQELQELAKQMRYEQEQIRQLQNIAEDQQRRELRQWQGENEKRWNQHMDLWQFHLDKQGKLDLQQTSRLDELAALIEANKDSLDGLSNHLGEYREVVDARLAAVWDIIDKSAEAALRAWNGVRTEIPNASERGTRATPTAKAKTT